MDERLLFQPEPDRVSGDVRWFLFHEGQILISDDRPQDPFPVFDPRFVEGMDGLERHYLGMLDDTHCMAVELPEPGLSVPGLYTESLRRLLVRLDHAQFAMFSRASQVLSWRRNHAFCSRCGQPARPDLSERTMICDACGYTQYPRITPCVIMLVTRGEEALLARSARFPEGFFSCLAGFMEPGETAEQAVAREVMEETGLSITNLRYHGSQSWPFPHSLMLGFTADYAGGEIRLEDDEIVEAHWYRPEQLPMMPPQGSIARSLIDTWCSSIGKGSPS